MFFKFARWKTWVAALKPGTTGYEASRTILDSNNEPADLARRTAKGGAIAVTAQCTRLAVQLLTMAVLARLLPPADFGLVAMAATVTGFAAIFTDLGLSTATVQRKEIDQDSVSALFYTSIAVGVTVMLLVVAAAPIAAWFFDDDRLTWIVAALAVPIPLAAAGRQHAAILQRRMHWLPLESTSLVAQALGGAIAIYLCWQLDWGYWALIAQSWVSAGITAVLLWIICPWRPGKVRSWQRAKPALGFGFHFTVFQFTNYLSRQFDDLLIGWRWGAQDLGLYNRAYLLLTLPLQLINAPFGSALVPALSRLQNEPDRWRAAYLEALGAVALISSGVTAIIVACAEPIVFVVFGPEWSEAGAIFLWLGVSMFSANILNTAGWIYISLGQSRRMMVWGFIATPAIVVAFLLGLPHGPVGVAMAYSIAVCALFVPGMWFATVKAPVSLTQVLAASTAPIGFGILCAVIGRFVFSETQSLGLLAAGLITAAGVGTCYLILALGLLFFAKPFGAVRKRILTFGPGYGN